MKGIELTPEHRIETVTDLAATAEESGFDTVLVSGHYNNRDQFVTLTSVANATDEVALGPGVTNPYEMHPAALASRVASLQEVSDGRAVFGIGAGDRSTLSNLGVEHDRPLRRVLETFSVARDLWDGERVTHDGTFRVDGARLTYDVAGTIPVYVGAQGPQMIRMAAKHADGVLMEGAHPEDFEWGARQVRAGLDERPADRGDFDFAAYASLSIDEDEAAAREAAKPPTAFIVGGASLPILDRHGIDRDVARAIGTLLEVGDFQTAFEQVTDDMIDSFCLAGTPERVGREIEGIMEHVDSFVAASPLGPDLESAVRLAGEVVPRSISE
ncbi:5,10-methylenetetrahydromethanopterin reductase [Halobacteriales archaeon QS_1_68_17]|nr:MAG: 5,10-methylenetetrahydromethanopterin reductase [Halobacteriales archaeon QS_1_68_17]